MNVVRAEVDWEPNSQFCQPARGGPLRQPAAEHGTSDLGDLHQENFTRDRFGAGQECQLHKVADVEPSNRFAKLHIIDALLTAHLLDILDIYAVAHA